MRFIRVIALGVAGVVVAIAIGIYALQEVGQEVVVLHRWAPDGDPDRTRLWIVDDGDLSWLHHQGADAPWIRRLAEDPVVTVERSGVTRQYRGTPDPGAHARVHDLTGKKHGFFARLLSPSPEDCSGMPVRLELIDG